MHRSNISYVDWSAGDANFVRRGKTPGDCEAGPGCVHCYVKRCWVRNPDAWPDHTTWYPEKLARLARCRLDPRGDWYRRGKDSKPIVFVCDTGDMFHTAVPEEFQVQALDVMASRTDIDWLVLTKRAEGLCKVVNLWVETRGWHKSPDHIWLGVTVPGDAQAGRLDWLMRTKTFSRWVSVEPMLDKLDIVKHLGLWVGELMWVAIGGESGGPKAREFPVFDAIELVRTLRARYVPVFVKQMGSWWMSEYGLHRLGEDPHGRDMLGWPMELRVQEFPRVSY